MGHYRDITLTEAYSLLSLVSFEDILEKEDNKNTKKLFASWTFPQRIKEENKRTIWTVVITTIEPILEIFLIPDLAAIVVDYFRFYSPTLQKQPALPSIRSSYVFSDPIRRSIFS